MPEKPKYFWFGKETYSMKAITVSDKSADADNLKLELKNIEIPKIKTNECLVKIHASGINPSDVKKFLEACMNKYNLDIIGLMCLPPNDKFPEKHFHNMKDLIMSLPISHQHQMTELSMGMSNDYIMAINYGSTYIRIGTKIFGERK